MADEQRASGCLFGLALGDAMGAPTEFLSIKEILRTFPPHGPVAPSEEVTDDTQMTLAVGEALLAAPRPFTSGGLERALREAFVAWLNSPDNNRAPGGTCLKACRNLAAGRPWHRATIVSSKGCGANMRVATVGLLPSAPDGVSDTERAAIAQFQAALTHGHPTALAASDLTAAAIHALVQGTDPQELPQRLRDYALSQRTIYHHDWLGSLWQQVGARTAEAFISHGWDECLQVLDRLDAALARPDRDRDPCLATGAGWIAEEAFGTALLCFLLFPDDPVAAIRRAAVTSGDSDSIACMAGALAGAYHGLNAWPEEWVRTVEYRDQLVRLGAAWDRGQELVLPVAR